MTINKQITKLLVFKKILDETPSFTLCCNVQIFIKEFVYFIRAHDLVSIKTNNKISKNVLGIVKIYHD